MTRKYTATIEIEDDCITYVHGEQMPDKPLSKSDILRCIADVDIAGLTVTVIPETFKRIPLKLPKKKKSER